MRTRLLCGTPVTSMGHELVMVIVNKRKKANPTMTRPKMCCYVDCAVEYRWYLANHLQSTAPANDCGTTCLLSSWIGLEVMTETLYQCHRSIQQQC